VTGSAYDRKAVLLRQLAIAEAKRLGIAPSEEQIRETTRWFRASFDLREVDRFVAWLRHAGLDWSRFQKMMIEMSTLNLVLAHHCDAIDVRMADHLAMHTVHGFGDWLRSQEQSNA
jgi:hypothetical protein